MQSIKTHMYQCSSRLSAMKMAFCSYCKIVCFWSTGIILLIIALKLVMEWDTIVDGLHGPMMLTVHNLDGRNQSQLTKHKNKTKVFPRIRSCSQQERLDHLRNVCGNVQNLHLQPHEYSFVDNQHKLIIKSTSKAGGTSLKSLLLKANGLPDAAFELLPQGKTMIHNNAIQNFFNIQLLKDQGLDQRDIILKEYSKLLVIRHPFERLMSVYRGKVLDLYTHSPEFARETLKMHYPDIFAHNKTLRNMRKPQAVLGAPSLGEFLGWVAMNKMVDKHWETLENSTHPCSLPWTSILRLETMKADGPLLTDILKPDIDMDNMPVQHSHKSGPVEDHDRMSIPEFDGVPDDVLQYFLNMYSLDMKLFGYKWDKSTNTAVCSLDTQNGPCC